MVNFQEFQVSGVSEVAIDFFEVPSSTGFMVEAING